MPLESPAAQDAATVRASVASHVLSRATQVGLLEGAICVSFTWSKQKMIPKDSKPRDDDDEEFADDIDEELDDDEEEFDEEIPEAFKSSELAEWKYIIDEKSAGVFVIRAEHIRRWAAVELSTASDDLDALIVECEKRLLGFIGSGFPGRFQ